MSRAPWWLDTSCPDITYDELERIRVVLDDRAAWQESVGEAHDARAAAGLFADWHASREWFHQLPAETPARGAQVVWARRELAALRRDMAHRQRPAAPAAPATPRGVQPPIIPADRQLEIALAALEARSRQKADTAWSAA